MKDTLINSLPVRRSVPGDGLSKRTLGVGLLVGGCHLLAVALVWAWLASTTDVPMGVKNPSVSQPGTVWFVGTTIGLVLLGVVPTILFVERRLVSPALIVAVWFTWGVYTTWESVHGGYFLSKPPLDLYALGGTWALVTALIGGVVESVSYRLRALLLRSTGE